MSCVGGMGGEKQTLMLEIGRCKCMHIGHIRCRDGNHLEKVIKEGIVVVFVVGDDH